MRLLSPVLLALGLLACQPTSSKAEQTGQGGEFQLAQAGAFSRQIPANQQQMQLSFAGVAAKASPAVVGVYAQRVVVERQMLYRDPIMRQFGIGIGVPVERVQQSLGSGVIVRADGVIVTNHHVVEGADALKVVLSDRREFDAKLITDDAKTDLAVLRIDAKGAKLPTLAFADTHASQVGDLVLAIGNPFGLRQTVTSGIISALGRTEVSINDYASFIQTDAAINQGNSGGALVDMQGNLVGINTAIFSQSGDSSGIGFAIPSEMVRRVVESAISGGKVVRPWIGARGQTVTQTLAGSLGLDAPRGVLISDVYPGGSADKAGLKRGDVVLSINGRAVYDDGGLKYEAATLRPGESMKLEVLRAKQRINLTAVASAAPRAPAPDPRDVSGNNPFSGTRVVTLSPAQAEDAGLDPFSNGVYIDQLSRGSIANQLGLLPGDIVREVNGQTIRNSADLDRVLKAGGGAWRVGIERKGETIVRDIRL
jgi:Do/DeqQ family serine protease